MAADGAKLLYFTAAYRPGSMAIPVHTELLAALAERGYPSAIVTLAPPGQAEPIAYVPDGDLPVYRVAISRGIRDRLANRYARTRLVYPFLLTAARYLGPWLRARLAADPDLVLQAEMAFPLGAVVRRALGGKAARTVVTLHGGDTLQRDDGEPYGYAWSRPVQRELRQVYGTVGRVRAMSPLLARAAQGLGCPPEKIAVVPLNVSAGFYPATPLPGLRAASRRAVLAELGLPDDARLLITSGRVLPIKGFDILVDALPAILARHSSTYLLLYGPDRGGTSEELKEQVATLGLTERVRFLGTLPYDGQGRFLAAADLSVIPSLLDGFNRHGVEAGAHGTPVVASAGAGIADFVTEYGAGRAVPLRDAPALATAISDLLADRDAWTQASAGAVRLADACRTPRVADELVKVYEEVGRVAP
jgi:glycosyltransferase involved in cell wall biosynthesis